jgi:hypothetical protein
MDYSGFDENGQPLTLPQEAVGAAYKAGKFKFAPGTRVPVVLNGARGTVPVEKLQTTLDDFGGELDVDPQGGLKAAALGALGSIPMAKTATVLGAQLIGGDEAAEKTRQAMEGLEQEHPGATLAGGALGLGAQLLTGTGETELAAKGLGEIGAGAETGARVGAALDGATAGAEAKGLASIAEQTARTQAETGGTPGSAIGTLFRGAGRVVNAPFQATSAAARVVSAPAERLFGRTVGGIVHAGTEGALLNAASALDEHEVGDTPFTGEALSTSLGDGFLFGGGLGLGGAVLGGGVRVLGSAAGRIADRLAEAGLGGAQGQTLRAAARFGPGEVGHFGLDNGILENPLLNQEQRYEKAQDLVEAIGKSIGDIFKSADKNYKGMGIADLRKEFQAQLQARVKELAPVSVDAQSAADWLMAKFDEHMGWQAPPDSIAPLDPRQIDVDYEQAWRERGLSDPNTLVPPRPVTDAQIRRRWRELMSQAEMPVADKIYYRVQPKGADLFNHQSGLGAEKNLGGVFAFEDPEQLYDTYTWNHVRKNLGDYEMVEFRGEPVARPEDSEGIVVKPTEELRRRPMQEGMEFPELRERRDLGIKMERPVERLSTAARIRAQEELKAQFDKATTSAEKYRITKIMADPLERDRYALARENEAVAARNAVRTKLREQATSEVASRYNEEKQKFDAASMAHLDLYQSIKNAHEGEHAIDAMLKTQAARKIDNDNRNLTRDFSHVWDFRRKVGAGVNWSRGSEAQTAAWQEMRKVARGVVENRIENGFNTEAKKLQDPEAFGQYLHAKKRFGLASSLEERLERGRARELNSYGQPSRFGVGAGVATALGGVMMGHPAAGIVGGLASHVARYQVAKVGAWALHKAAKFAELKAVRAEMEIAMRRSTRAALEGRGADLPDFSSAERLSPTIPPHQARLSAARAMEVVARAAGGHTRLESRLASLDPALDIMAPEAAKATANAARTKLLWLVSQIPPSAQADIAKGQTPQLSDTQARTFADQAAVTQDPRTITDAFAHGTLTPAMVAAGNATHPAAMARVYATIERQQQQSDKDFIRLMHPNRQAQIQLLMGDRGLPGMAAQLQMNAASMVGGPPSPPQGRRGKRNAASGQMISGAGLMSTLSQQIESSSPGRREKNQGLGE